MLQSGATFAGKYRIDHVIGEGGMGVVYAAFHLRLQQRVAIKVLREELLGEADLVERFEREARAAATLESPNVAKVLDVDETSEGVPYIVIEYLVGHDLGAELQTRLSLPIGEAVSIVLEACAPVAEAHARGIIHRDLKPSNLFLTTKGGRRMVKLLDFGISKIKTEDGKLTSSRQLLGTPHYMSPEQVRGAHAVDHRSDIWSLGVILYELLVGVVPFPGEAGAAIAGIAADAVVPPRSINSAIPPALESAIMCALQKDRANRFENVQAFVAALAPFAPKEALAPCRDSLHTPILFAETLSAPRSNAGVAAGHHDVTLSPSSFPKTLPPSRMKAWMWASGAVLGVIVAGVGFWRATAQSGSTVVGAPLVASDNGAPRAQPPPPVADTTDTSAKPSIATPSINADARPTLPPITAAHSARAATSSTAPPARSPPLPTAVGAPLTL